MKKLGFILALIFFIHCSETQTTETDTPDNFTLIGQILDNISLNTITNLEVRLEGNSVSFDTTNSEGKFIFSNITPGEYKLYINDSNYAPYDSLLSIPKDSSLVIKLSKLFYDYFPLKINNSWKYRYTFKIGDNSVCVGVPYKTREGWETWTITNIQEDSIYEFTKSLHVFLLNPLFNELDCVIDYDTIDYIQEESKFYLKEYNNSQIKAIEGSDLFNGAIYSLQIL